jgi:hypothetical protein
MEITKETLDEIVKRIDENVQEIRVQTTKTNSRVSHLEAWKNRVTGGLIITDIILIPVIITFVIKYL